MELFRACFDREILLMKKSPFVYTFKTIQIFIIAGISVSDFFLTNMRHKILSNGSKPQNYKSKGVHRVNFEHNVDFELSKWGELKSRKIEEKDSTIFISRNQIRFLRDKEECFIQTQIQNC